MMRRNDGHNPDLRQPASVSQERGSLPPDDRTLGELFKELGRETQMLVRQEIQLATAELNDKAAEAGRSAGLIAAGGVIALSGLLALVMSLGFLLGSFMPTWLGFLLAGVFVAAVGGMLAMSGLKGLKKTNFSLERTAATLQEDKLWTKQEAQEIKRDPKHLGGAP